MKNYMKRCIAAVLAATLLFTDCTEGFAAQTYSPVTADTELREDTGATQETDTAESEETADEEAVSENTDTERPPQILFELEDLRTQTGKQYRLSDGSILAAGYAMDIHYEDEEGEWKEIDNRFLYEAAKDGEDFDGYTTAEGAVEFKFAPMVQDGEILRVTQGDYFVGFQMLPPATQEDAEAVEPGIPVELPEDEATEGSGEATEISGKEQTTASDEEIPREIQPGPEESAVTGDEPALSEEPAEAEDESVASKGKLTENLSETEGEEETAEESKEEQSEVQEETASSELSPAPLLFLKGDVLNAEEVPAQMQELSAQAASVDSGQAATFSLKGIVQTEALQETQDLSDAEEAMEKSPEVVWTKLSEAVPEEEEAELLEAMEMDKAVTCVGYGNVLPGVSLQYVLSGSSLKEYILINQAQDSYSYDFELNLENLEPQMQEDGSILLNDMQTGEAVYEIPSAYMTDTAGAYSDAVEMEVSETEDGSFMLKITADPEWINADERVFPVQIDPTLNGALNSTDDIRGSYVASGFNNQSYVNPAYLMVGYGGSSIQELRTYIQLRNLPELPENSIICGAVCHFAVAGFDNVNCSSMHIIAKRASDTWWDDMLTWNTKPNTDPTAMDYRTITSASQGSYAGFHITELVKDHYRYEDRENNITTFALEAYGGYDMTDSKCAIAALLLKAPSGYPILQIQYRDTKGIEGYYTYQTQDIGNAGTGYVADFTSQLTLVKPIASYESTIQSYGLSLVYNSAWGQNYFTDNGDSIHTGNFTNMTPGAGWKLSAQETVITISLEDMDGTATWLVYNDSDGTEHYFRKSKNNSSLYEDEDGLNLTITKSGSNFTMKDKKGNEKFFEKGYLTKITDANGNRIHIVYNGGTPGEGKLKNDGTDRITAVYSQIKNSETPEKIFTLSYGDGNLLAGITEIYGRSLKLSYGTIGGLKYLQSISAAASSGGTYEVNARYSYDASHGRLNKALDAESSYGMFYDYEKSATGYRISGFYEGRVTDTGACIKGNIVQSSGDELRKTVYRDLGTDRTANTADDILTTCLFGSSGQTINISSKDVQGNLLGVTACAYVANSATSGKNNRISETVSSGQVGVNLLTNGSFERYTQGDSKPIADGWKTNISGNVQGGSIACTTTAPHHSGNAHFNLYNSGTEGSRMIYRTVSLVKNKTYTASVYVNTTSAASFASGGGAFLRIKSSDGTQVVNGPALSYKTDPGIDGGWQRISVTMTASKSADYNICLIWNQAKGTLRADDIQLEMAEAPSSFNLLEDGSFESGGDFWHETDNGWATYESTGAFHGTGVFHANEAPGRSVWTEQTVQINQSSNTTFLLSGWSKGDGVPDPDKTGDSESGRFWGLNLKLTYSDGTSETHNLPFNEYVHEWQYAAMAVTPKQANKTISTATLRVCYYHECNDAWFDCLSLTKEPAQTYKYDADGNLTSVKTGGDGTKETYQYQDGTKDLLSAATKGSGTYTYQYNSAHQPTSVTNDTVTMTIGYDSYGQSTATVLKNKAGNLQMKSTALYENGLLISQRDRTGAKSVYTYDTKRRLIASKNAKDQTIKTSYDDTRNRVSQTYQAGVLAVAYDYTKGNLSKISRSGYITEDDGTKSKVSQSYSFTYDGYGNRTSASVGTVRLAAYAYNSNNGTLKTMTYGPASSPLAMVSYSYDKLDRVTKAVYHDNNSSTDTTYGYRYSSDGSLAGITVGGKLKYAYQYDSLGRLINSTKLDGEKVTLQTQHRYDTSDRITAQSWQIGSDAFSESYTYNNTDGTLASMKIGSDTLRFTYNTLKQLTGRITPRMEEAYLYRSPSSGTTTNQISYIKYRTVKKDSDDTQSEIIPALGYIYDAIGNITKITSGASDAVQYTYDDQNQLTEEVLKGAGSCKYTYDTYGNIRERILNNESGLKETFTYEYGNDNWPDQLTKVTYTNSDGTTRSQSLTYDAIGNPTSYYNGKTAWSLTWKNGRQLAKAVSGATTITNTYDVDGIRDSKTVGNVKHDYVTLDGKVVRETFGTTATADYLYDNNRRPYQITVKEGTSTYTGYFVLNQQGDVIAILNASGAAVVTYTYDAWGRQLSCTTSTTTGAKLYTYNRLKYRGYYYDSDLLLYDLGSRFYDPVLGRFLNADGAISGISGEMLGYNMYAYCMNNPVNMSDSTGNWPKLSTIFTGAAVAALAVATVAVCVAAAPVVAGIGVAGGAAAASLATIAAGVSAVSATAAVVTKKVENASTKKSYRNQSVYVMRNSKTKEIQYVGRTNDPNRRQREHNRDPRKDHLDPLEVKFTGLTVPEARAMEQLLISAYTIQNLDNARREIAAGKVSGFAGKIENIINIFGSAAEDEFLNLMER